jgi:hypothetical protein
LLINLAHAMLTAHDLSSLSHRELRARLAQGHPLRPDDVAGSAFRGVSLGVPALVERLTWKTFQKAFFRDNARGIVRGWNVRVEQRGTSSPGVPRLRGGSPWTFGHFLVREAAGRAPAGCDAGLLLDYGPLASRLDPLSAMRDPLVAVNPGSTDLLLGWSYLQIGPRCVPTPSFFSLEREGPVVHIPQPGRG